MVFFNQKETNTHVVVVAPPRAADAAAVRTTSSRRNSGNTRGDRSSYNNGSHHNAPGGPEGVALEQQVHGALKGGTHSGLYSNSGDAETHSLRPSPPGVGQGRAGAVRGAGRGSPGEGVPPGRNSRARNRGDRPHRRKDRKDRSRSSPAWCSRTVERARSRLLLPFGEVYFFIFLFIFFFFYNITVANVLAP